jgi:hypothetical protein
MFEPRPTSWNPKTIEENGYSVTFLRNPACYPYLRETTMYLFLKDGIAQLTKAEGDGDHLVAFELPLHVQNRKGHQHNWFRVWTFNSRDPYFEPGVPCEAVRPCDIVPGRETPGYQPLWEFVYVERMTSSKKQSANKNRNRSEPESHDSLDAARNEGQT